MNDFFRDPPPADGRPVESLKPEDAQVIAARISEMLTPDERNIAISNEDPPPGVRFTNAMIFLRKALHYSI